MSSFERHAADWSLRERRGFDSGGPAEIGGRGMRLTTLRHSCWRSALMMSAVLWLAARAQAQTLGGFEGTVRDSSGAIIPDAKISVTNTATNVSRATLSNEAGVYSIPALPPGTYD